MISYNFQINNPNENKTLNEMIQESFAPKKQAIDLSFFYKDDYKNRKEVKNINPPKQKNRN